jgi:hypothetical protein
MALRTADDQIRANEAVVPSKTPLDGLLGLAKRQAPDQYVARQRHVELTHRIDDQAFEDLCLRRNRCELNYITRKQLQRLRRIGFEAHGAYSLRGRKRRVISRYRRRLGIAVTRAPGYEGNRKKECRVLAHTCG